MASGSAIDETITRSLTIDIDGMAKRGELWPANWQNNFAVADCFDWVKRGSKQLAPLELYWFRSSATRHSVESPLVPIIQIEMWRDMLRRTLRAMYDAEAEECRRAPVRHNSGH